MTTATTYGCYPNGLAVDTPPAEEPVSREEAKLWCKVDTDADDEVIDALIAAARERCERVADRQLVTATLVASFNAFGPALKLRPPLQSVEEITYLDTAGVEQTVDSDVYRVLTNREPGIVQLALYQTWPSAVYLADSVNVTFVSGYGNAEDVPAEIRIALRRCIDHLYTMRGDANEEYMDSLFRPFWSGGDK